ncbi:MAG: TrbC/VirB2 family protein [Candidatus Staskawiczbacteria bacterium]|nr:TrbC/VirB2 family protein [Candidatus Staskawiczbacteria bacterium]
MNKKILFLILLAGVFIFPLQAMGAVPATLTTVLENIRDVIKAIGTAMIVVGFVVAGIMYLISGGSSEKMGTAKKAAIAALIGAVIVILAYAANGIEAIIKGILGVT